MPSIGKVTASLQLPLEAPDAIETVSVLRSALMTAHVHWLVQPGKKKKKKKKLS